MIQLPAPAHIEITWQVAGVLVLIIGAATGGMAKYVSSSITTSLLKFQVRLIKELNGTYVSQRSCDLIHKSLSVAKGRAAEELAENVTQTAKELDVKRRLEQLERRGHEQYHNYD
jgi:hypothetical protein